LSKRGGNKYLSNGRHLSSFDKECARCEVIKPLIDFHNCKGAPGDKAYYCKECAITSARKHHKERVKDPIARRKYSSRYYKHKYNLTAEEYDTKYKQQQSCAICFTTLLGGLQTHLDHDHSTGKLREFLCTNCNRGLGHFQDSKQNLMNAIAYLEKHTDNAESEGRAAVHG
jgi:hypothetical protein